MRQQTEQLLTIKEASKWASGFLKCEVNESNLAATTKITIASLQRV